MVCRWHVNGGKSNAYFAKTLNERYVLKSLSKAEKVSLLEKLATNYLTYMDDNLSNNNDVSLAKIIAIFHVK